MRELCSIHNLALGPNGKCVLCRRPKPTVFAVREETESVLSKVFTWFLGACLVAAAGALFFTSRLDQGYSGARYSSGPEAALEGAAPKPAAAQPAPSKGKPSESEAAKQAQEHASRTTKAPAPKPVISGPPVPVTMYATPWCFICDRARDFLGARNVTLIELDIERDHAAKAKLAKVNPALSLPTFELGGKAYVGFNPWQLEDAIREAAASQQLSARAP